MESYKSSIRAIKPDVVKPWLRRGRTAYEGSERGKNRRSSSFRVEPSIRKSIIAGLGRETNLMRTTRVKKRNVWRVGEGYIQNGVPWTIWLETSTAVCQRFGFKTRETRYW